MPRRRQSLPKYRKHRASGQAVVTLSGRDCYLGPHGTKASRLEYDRLIAEWLQQGRNLPGDTREHELSIAEVILAYVQREASQRYVKHGKPTSELAEVKLALRPLRELYGTHRVSDFGPARLEVVRERIIESGVARTTVNKRVEKIRRCFRWAAAKELIDAQIPVRLDMLEGLRKGRSAAAEREPITPVDDATIEATLPFLPQVVADMVRLQRVTGMRPGEVCQLRPADVDRTGQV